MRTADNSSLLTLKQYASGYRDRPVFAPVDVALNEGRVILVQGENGAGKSTLLRGVAGLCRYEEGRILLSGHDIHKTVAYRRLRGLVAYISQLGGVFDSLSIEENLSLSQAILSGDRSAGARQVNVVASFETLRKRKKTKVGALSGGEKRFVALARALSTGAKVLLLDEPLAGLASDARSAVIDLVFSIVQETRCGALWTEHSALDLASRCEGVVNVIPSI